MKSKIKIHLIFLFTFLIISIPNLVFGDKGMMVWPPQVRLDQSAQNAIVAWNGEEEVLILSTNVSKEKSLYPRAESWSTYANCNTDKDCRVGGCSGELCGGKDEKLISPCVYRLSPGKLGYECKCKENKCQWTKTKPLKKKALALEILPLPSEPVIKEGSFQSFKKLTQIINEKRKEMIEWKALPQEKPQAEAVPGVEVIFHKKLGAHDLTTVKVNHLGDFLSWIKEFTKKKGLKEKEISSKFKQGLRNYLQREIKYFVFDVIEVGSKKQSVKPIIYKFKSDFLYYPMRISAISEIGESRAKIHLFLIAKEFLESKYLEELPVTLSHKELQEVDQSISQLFKSKALVLSFKIRKKLAELNRDFLRFPSKIWKRDLSWGDSGKDVKLLQKILINENLWKSKVKATGYFGKITKKALARFQEEHQYKILTPIGLKKGTGYFGPKTRKFFKQFSIKTEKPPKIFIRDLHLGMRGKDVQTLQNILIEEGVWDRPKIGATGYFGPITKKALIKFQQKYSSEILEPLGLEKGTGYFGPSTRTFLQKKKKKKEITITTDKTEYNQGEKVKITIKNSTFKTKEFIPPFYGIQKFTEGKWKNINIEMCKCPDVLCKVRFF